MDKQKLLSKLNNFWYYHKWHLLLVLFLVATFIVGVRSCQQRPNPDLYVLFTKKDNQIPFQATQLEEFFGAMVEDLNGDGKTTALVTQVALKAQDGTNSATMLVQVNSGHSVLYILTDETYRILHENNVLADLGGLGQSDYIDGDRYLLSASGILDDMEYFKNDDTIYYLGIRKVDGTTLEDSEEHRAQLRLAESVMKQLIKRT